MIKRFLLATLFAGCCISASARPSAETARIADEANTSDWLSFGRTYSERFFSPLQDINTRNVANLGLAWSMEVPDATSLEATPLVVNGIMYFTTSESAVYAVDAKSGKKLWRYDPEIWRYAGKRFRNNFHVNRGVAFWKGRIFLGAFDGRLIALDARNGRKVWAVQTLDEYSSGYITGAPRVFNDKVIIGFGGAEVGKARGYVTAYDTHTGKKLWRFYVVPGDPSKGFENKAMALAATTWTGEWWKFGGGGTIWNSMTYDPEMNRIYLGTGNGTPWNRKVRSPGGGDNLFLCSIVALDADTGEYVWHYQTTPGESWDFNSSMDMTLAELNINGEKRKVILHAPKNGFFYVIDRQSGKLISAEKLGKVTWAEKIDLATGRPVENPEARARVALFWPGMMGMHNWQPMSFNPMTGLVYIPTLEMPGFYSDANTDLKSWRLKPDMFNNGYDPVLIDVDSPPPSDMKFSAALIAWDPVKMHKVWEVPMPGLWNGGILSTGGNLVFQGNAAGEFAAYDATSGAKLWSMPAGLGIIAAPITYKLNGKQYVSVLVGWGGALGAFGINVKQHGWDYGKQPRRLLTFLLDGKAQLPPTPAPQLAVPIDDRDLVIDEAAAAKGRGIYNVLCPACHGVEGIAGGSAPDLRASTVSLKLSTFSALMKEGMLQSQGMPKYDDLTEEEIRQIHMFIRDRARKDIAKVSASH